MASCDAEQKEKTARKLKCVCVCVCVCGRTSWTWADSNRSVSRCWKKNATLAGVLIIIIITISILSTPEIKSDENVINQTNQSNKEKINPDDKRSKCVTDWPTICMISPWKSLRNTQIKYSINVTSLKDNTLNVVWVFWKLTKRNEDDFSGN